MAFGAVPITLDRDRQLRFDIEALADLKKLTGKSLLALISEMQAGDVVALRDCLWAGLKHEDRSLDNQTTGLRRVGILIETALAQERIKISDLGDAVAKAIDASRIYGKLLPETDNGASAPPSEATPPA
jgi:hypothetical protein